jgi:preprotein translocase subunit SecG
MLYYLVMTLYVIVCFLLIIVILLQQGKGGDIASAFGGGSSQAVFGARSGATLLTRATSVLAVLFVLGSLMLTVWGTRGSGSVVGGIQGPPPPAPTPINGTPGSGQPVAPGIPAPPSNSSPQ